MSDFYFTNLPTPDVLEMPSYQVVLQENMALLQSVLPHYQPLASDDFSLVLEAFAYRELHLRQAFNNRLRASMLLYAQGNDLDVEAVRYGVQRLDAEADAPFRTRIFSSLHGHSTAGSHESYQYHAKSVSSLIDDVHTFSPQKGKVTVVIASFTPDSVDDDGELIPVINTDVQRQVTTALNHDKVRPITDEVSVVIASNKEVVIEAKLQVFNADQQQSISQHIHNNFNFQLAIGHDLTFSQMIRYLHVDGVYKVELLNHNQDIACLDHEIIRITELRLAFVAADNDEVNHGAL